MQRSLPVVLLLALCGAFFLAPAPARAQATDLEVTDRALLSTFCDAADIKGDSCSHAREYPGAGASGCDVTLTADRHQGRFIASGNPLLVAAYESGCEAHANDNGGAVVFEEVAGKYVFRSFEPGAQAGDCITLPKDEREDWLVCLTGHMGQGVLDSGVTQMAFTEDADKRVRISPDVLVTAEDSSDASGANVVTCKEPSKYFEVSKLAAGPRPNTVTVDASYADSKTIQTACGKGFPAPDETFGKLAPGEAYVPEGFEKNGKLVIDLATRKVVPQN